MKLYLDSADIQVIGSLMQTGVFTGVTTNPLILREAGVRLSQLSDFADYVLRLGAKEVFLQTWGEDAVSLFSHGEQLARISSQVVVKLPVTREGLEAAAKLAKASIKTCLTAVYAPFQALLAAAVEATYVAPYLGRMNDAGRDGHALIAQMAAAIYKTENRTEILAASVRSPEDVARLAQNGVRCLTLSPTVADKLFQEPLTLEAVSRFEAAARDL